MSIYCTYLTVYSGSKLPLFYIGSGLISKITRKRNPYHGSVASKEYRLIWKSELKHNRHLFKTHIIKTFKTRNEAFLSEEYLQRKFNVVGNPMYINKAIANQTFNMTGKKHTEASLKKMSENSQRRKLTDEEKKHLRDLNLNMITVFDVNNNVYKRASLINDKELIESEDYIPAGKLRNNASREKSKNIMSDRYFSYNPETNEQIFLKTNISMPDGFVLGMPDSYSVLAIERFTGDNFFYNTITGEQIRSKIAPEGLQWKMGKTNFGINGNPFKGNISGKDIRTMLNVIISKDSSERVYIVSHNTKTILRYNRTYSSNQERFINHLNKICVNFTKSHIRSLKTKPTVLNGIESILLKDYVYDVTHTWI